MILEGIFYVGDVPVCVVTFLVNPFGRAKVEHERLWHAERHALLLLLSQIRGC